MDIGFADKVALAESRDRSRPFGLKVPLDVKRQDAHRRAAVRRSNRCLVALYLSQICKTSLQCAYLRQIAVPLGRPGDARRLRLDSAQGLCKLKLRSSRGQAEVRFQHNRRSGLDGGHGAPGTLRGLTCIMSCKRRPLAGPPFFMTCASFGRSLPVVHGFPPITRG